MNNHKYGVENLLSILSENNFVYSVNDSFEYADVQGYAYYIGFPIFIGDSVDKVYTILGKSYHTNTIMYDDRLLYLISEDYWVSIGVNNKKVLSIDILFDCEIIDNVRKIMDDS